MHDWKRYLAAVLAVAFSGLLMLVQLGLLLGMFGTVTAIVDQSSADLWVVDGRTESFDLAREMPRRYEMELRAHRQVETVQMLIYGSADWRRSDGGTMSVSLVGVDVSDRSLATPVNVSPALRVALEPLGTVAIDRSDRAKLGVASGGATEINGHRVRVVGTVRGMRAIGGANVVMSQATARLLLTSPGESTGEGSAYFLVKLRDRHHAARVRDELQPPGAMPRYRVLFPDELSAMSQAYWLLESGAGAGFGFSAALGLIVGIAIASQTLRGAILVSLREYATLRALGVSLRSLRWVVLEQAFWVGVTGLTSGCALLAIAFVAAKALDVAIVIPWWGALSTAVLCLTVSMISGLLALRPLYQTEPLDLMR